MSYLSPTPVPPQTWEIPAEIAKRLATAPIDKLLYGPNRIYDAENVAEPNGPEEDDKSWPWARIIVRLAEPIYGTAREDPGGIQRVRPLVIVEVHRPADSFSVRRAMEAIHSAVYARLAGFKPTLTRAALQLNGMWREGFVNKRPLFDEGRGTWIVTAEYGLIIGPTG